MMTVNNRYLFLLITITSFLFISASYALDDSVQLKLERAGRLLASTFVIGNPDEKLFGLHPDYAPARPREMINKDIAITVKTKHSIQETKEKVLTIKGLENFEKWVIDVRNNYRIRENLQARTMGTCIDGCCNYPIDGGMSHNTLYLEKACFVIEDKTPFLKSITLLDGD